MDQKINRRIYTLVLVLGVLALGIMLLEGGWPFEQETMPLPTPTITQTSSPSASPSPTGTATLATAQPTSTRASGTPGFPAGEQWATYALEAILQNLKPVDPPDTGLIWWQGSSLQGELTVIDNAIAINEIALDLIHESMILLMVPDPEDPNELLHQATINQENGALRLSLAGEHNVDDQWVLSANDPGVALRALIKQAETQDSILITAYNEIPERAVQLIFVETKRLPSRDTPTPAPLTPTPSPTLTNTLQPNPTPTPYPDAVLGQIVAENIDPVIETVRNHSSETLEGYHDKHPWAGTLEWTNDGAQVAGRAIAVDQAEELNVYVLQADAPQGPTSRFLHAAYRYLGTHLPEESASFPGHRLEEIAYWMVQRAEQHGGKLIVAYDDFDTRQAITVIGFQPNDSTQP